MIGTDAKKTELRAPIFSFNHEKTHAAELPSSLPGGVRISMHWQRSLDVLIEELERLPAITEERFLKVGAMLQEMSKQLQTIGAGTGMAASMMSGEEPLAVVRDMEMLVDSLEMDFLVADRTAGHVSNLLEKILEELRSMERLMESFKGHVSNLRMLKLLTNIQGASLTERGVSFRNLANDIGALSQNINLKSTAILSRIRALSANMVKGRSMVAGLGVTQQQLTGKMVSAVRTKIALMSEMNAKCSVAARELSSRSGEISRNVGAIVVALQFQDITRQQMEHARETLDDVRRRIGSTASAAPARILSDEMAGICELQSAQLLNSAEELMVAVNGIDFSLQGVSLEAADSSARLHGLFSQADGAGRSSLADIELGLNSLLKAFDENMAVRESLSGIILATTAAMGEITGFAEEIDFLGSEIRLIALNAIVKAAQAGREGMAFNVIAENVKQQSDEICSQTATITSAIETIASHVADLRRETDAKDEKANMLRHEELDATVARLKGLVTEAGELLLSTDQAADSLVAIIDGATAALSSREFSATVHKDLFPWVKRLTGGLQPGAHKALTGNWSEGVQSAELRYTMGSERAVHQKFLASAATEKELPRPFSTGADHFERNVEFF